MSSVREAGEEKAFLDTKQIDTEAMARVRCHDTWAIGETIDTHWKVRLPFTRVFALTRW